MATVISIAPYKFLPAKVGGQKNIALFYKYFSRYQKLICVTVANNENSLAEGYEALPFFSSSQLRYINPFNFFRLQKLIKEKKATHLMMEHPYFGWLAFLLKKATGVQLIIHSHNIEGLRFKSLGKWWWKLLWYYEKFIHQQANYNLFITEEDLNYALAHFQLDPQKCMVATYGIERSAPPSKEEREEAKEFLCYKYNLQEEEKILLFVGAFNYKPNVDAFTVITEQISPLLKEQNFPYKIFVCGPGLSPDQTSDPNIIITGFVDDISLYFKGADVFINPVVEGGGIKTKLVEALGNNLNAVSTESGAFGVAKRLCTQKLHIVSSNNWKAFTTAIVSLANKKTDIPESYFHHFDWKHIAERTALFIE